MNAYDETMLILHESCDEGIITEAEKKKLIEKIKDKVKSIDKKKLAKNAAKAAGAAALGYGAYKYHKDKVDKAYTNDRDAQRMTDEIDMNNMRNRHVYEINNKILEIGKLKSKIRRLEDEIEHYKDNKNDEEHRKRIEKVVELKAKSKKLDDELQYTIDCLKNPAKMVRSAFDPNSPF